MSQSGFLLIADISGYTEFIQLHNMRKRPIVGDKMADMFESHAEVIISDLLETVIDAIEPKMQLNKLEGDAAFFFCDVKDDKNQSDEIIELMDAANEAFKAKLTELVFVQACGCDPCRQSKNLRLKIVAHKGEFTVQKIRRFEELAGEDAHGNGQRCRGGRGARELTFTQHLRSDALQRLTRTTSPERVPRRYDGGGRRRPQQEDARHI